MTSRRGGEVAYDFSRAGHVISASPALICPRSIVYVILKLICRGAFLVVTEIAIAIFGVINMFLTSHLSTCSRDTRDVFPVVLSDI